MSLLNKKVSLVLLMSLLNYASVEAQVKSYREAIGLKGNVKTLQVEGGEIAELSGKYIEKCCSLLYKLSFDINGNLIKADSSLHTIDSEPVNPLAKKATYDDKGKLVEESVYEPDGSLLSKIVYKYDVNGNKVESSTYSAKGSLFRKETFGYDLNQNIIEYIDYFGDGIPVTKRTYPKHDDRGNWVKQIIWHWDSSKAKWEPYTVNYRTITYY